MEIEDRVKNILKLDKEKENGITKDTAKGDSELAVLINNFHDNCQSLSSPVKKDKGMNYSPYSSSDSEYYSSEEIETNTDDLRNDDDQKTASSSEKELDVSDLRNKLMSVTEENEALNCKYQEALSKIQAAEAMNKKLRDEKDERQREISAQVKDLEGQMSSLKLEIGSLHDKKREMEVQFAAKANEAEQLGEKNKELYAQVSKLELMFKERGNEVSKIEELKSQVMYVQQEMDSLRAPKEQAIEQVDVMKQDLVSLTSQKNKLELLLKEKTKAISEYLIQVKSLKEELIKKTEFEQEMLKEKEASTQNLELKEKIDDLQQKLDNFQEKKSKLNSQIVGEKQEFSKSLTELEQQNIKLTNKISDQQKIMKNQEDTIKNLTEESKKAKLQILGSKTSLQIAERKMTELAEDFRKRLEDNIRVLFRRIQVTEQLHNETKESYKKTLKQLEESNRLLADKGHSMKMRDMLELQKMAFSGMESVALKLEANGELSNRLSKMTDELALAKNWVTERNNYKKRLQQQVQSLIEKPGDKEEQESLLREEVPNLEAKLGKQGGDRLNMIRTLENRIKEQDAELLSLGEEKREAIRQLCLFIDYHRTDCDYLKGEIAKIVRTSKTKS